MLTSLEPVGTRFFGPEFSFYIDTVEGEYKRVYRLLEHLRESLQELRETNNSLLSTKQNEVMKTLTVLAFIFLPLSFVASLFGMNTQHIPIVGSPYDFWIVLGGMAVIALSSICFFRYKGWL
jgi:magnesium transporter